MCIPCSISLNLEGAKALVEKLPEEVREVIQGGERKRDSESKKYKEAYLVYHYKHVCRMDLWLPEVLAAFSHWKEDPTVYLTM